MLGPIDVVENRQDLHVPILDEMLPCHPTSWKEDQPDHEDLKALDDTLPTRMLAVETTLSGDW